MIAKTTLSGYLLGRSLALAALMPLAALNILRFGGASHPSFSAFFAFTATSFTFSLVTAVVARRGRPNRALLAVQPVWDAVYCTALLFISGGIYSPFVFLYLLLIIGSAVILYMRGAVATATLLSFAYVTLALLQGGGYLTPFNPFQLTMEHPSTLAPKITFHIAAFFAVAVLSGYLTEALREAGESLERAHGEIEDLTHLQAAILRSMGSGLMAVDEDGAVRFFNQAAETLLLRAGIPMERHRELFILSRSDRNEVRIPGTPGMVLGYSVFPMTSRDGMNFGKLITFQDLTEVRKLEEGLKRSDRMAAVGRLAAGLAHEVRNPLASLSGSVQMLQSAVEGSGEERELLFRIVLRETERLNHLVTDFLGYARPGEVRVTEFDLRELVQEAGFFFTQGEGREGFVLRLEMDEKVPIRADREQFESLLLNLFRNSLEAAPGGVTVTVRAATEGDFCLLTVADDGPGMDPAVAEKAFEPFVSSKVGGTGLGLATVDRIIQGHGGTLAMETPPGGGLAFRMRFPTGLSD